MGLVLTSDESKFCIKEYGVLSVMMTLDRMRLQLRAVILITGKCFFLCEAQREKAYCLTCAPNGNPPTHPRSLIRVYVVHMKTLCILGNLNYAQ